MTDPRLRTYTWIFAAAVIAYSIAFFLFQYEAFAFLQMPTAILELISFLAFFVFAARALQMLRFRWLWVVLALVAEIAIPSGISLLVTGKLQEIDAPRIWWLVTFFIISILKLVIAGGILLWRASHAGTIANERPR